MFDEAYFCKRKAIQLNTLKKHSIIALIVFGCFLSFERLAAQALDPPQLNCVSVNGAGGVNLSWDTPADPNGEFSNYVIYSSTDYINFNQIAQINNYATTSFVDVNTDALTQSVCYYMITNSNNGMPQQSVSSDTTCTVLMELDQSNPVGFAVLDWGLILPGDPPGTGWEVYVEYPAGNWTLAETLPFNTTFYEYEVSTCGEFLNFRVNLITNDGCNYFSNIEGDFFEDTTAPEIPSIISVDVDSLSNLAVIEWEAASAGDTDGYIIYECLNGFTLILDTLWGQFNTTYTNPASSAGVSGPESYTVASFDTCLVGNPPSPNTSPTSSLCQRSMFLTASWFPCTEDVNLSWTPYEGWDQGISFYEVYVKVGANAPQLLDVVDGTTLNYTHVGITPGLSYRYFIKAYAALDPYDAISNVFELNTTQFLEPSYVYLASASVLEKNLVGLDLFLQAVPENFYFNLQRLDAPGEEWETIFVQVANNTNFLQFTDPTALTSEQSYQYRIKVDDECGDSVMVSNLAETIFLSGLANSSNFVNTLNWNEYGDWDTGIAQHSIYRSIDDGQPEVLIDNVIASQLFYEDDVIDLLLTPGEFCYRVEARENPNFLGITGSSFSNQVCLTQEPKIWIPNAFIVYGINNEFKPVISFADFDNYQMIIYNRWGDAIFETNDINTGWDGRVGGNIAQEGQYMYYISVADGFGSLIERRGAVLMLVGKD